MEKKLFVFVEGDDDERFIEWYFQNKAIQVIQYSREKKSRICGYLKTAISLCEQGLLEDFIITGDCDNKTLNDALSSLSLRFNIADRDKMVIVIKEIEGWYIAGIDKRFCEKFKFKEMVDCNSITKEDFDKYILRYSRKDMMIEILKNYSFEKAIEKNNSFKYFNNKYIR